MDILRVATAGCTMPTQIMYKSNTSWIVLQKNLESLIAAGFMRQSDDGTRTEYAVTERGVAIVREYFNLVHLMAVGGSSFLAEAPRT